MRQLATRNRLPWTKGKTALNRERRLGDSPLPHLIVRDVAAGIVVDRHPETRLPTGVAIEADDPLIGKQTGG